MACGRVAFSELLAGILRWRIPHNPRLHYKLATIVGKQFQLSDRRRQRGAIIRRRNQDCLGPREIGMLFSLWQKNSLTST
jgi:hypothetical protein